jgi:hypothetical protein
MTAALEWADYQASLCSGCGLPKDSTMDPDMHGMFEVVPVQCFACAAKDAEEREVSEGRLPKAALDGVYFAVQERREA